MPWRLMSPNSMNKPAPDAPEGPVLRTQHGPPQCFAPLYATDTWDNEAAPPREVIGSLFVNRANFAPCGIRWGHYRTLSHRWMPRPGGDRSSMPTRAGRPAGQYCSLLHFRCALGLFGISHFLMSAAKPSCSAFLMASDRIDPAGNFLACARASDARAAQS